VRSQSEHLWVCLTISIAFLEWDTVGSVKTYTRVFPSRQIVDSGNNRCIVVWAIDVVET
jgi:hypothetical protein